MASFLTILLSIPLCTYMFLWGLLRFTQSKTEPFAIETSIPFISPAISMWRKGPNYWTGPHRRFPIYTIRLPWIRLYIVQSTTLIPAVQKQVQTISFVPVMVKMAETIMGGSKSAQKIISRDPLNDTGNGHIPGLVKVIHKTLLPGTKLDALNRRSVQFVKASMDALALDVQSNGPAKINMCQWISHQVLVATTEGIYGPQNPFRDNSAVHAFREFEEGILPILISPLPSITARRHIRARETLLKAYITYYEGKGYEDPQTSAFIRDRQQYFSSEGLSLEDIARSEMMTSIALLSNTMPATFWLVHHIISDPTVLADCRQELTRAFQTDGRAADDAVRSIDIDYIRRHCPIMLSTFKEIFRYHGVGISSRVILEDHILDDRFLLKKDNILLIPGVVQHKERSIWGDDVDKFSHRRFVNEPVGGKAARKLNAVAFRGFGGGSTLCPGRHFAATEIMAFAALFILRFDSRPASGGKWVMPTVENTNLATSIHQPDHDVEIEMSLRDNYRGKWEVKLSESDVPMEVSAEDVPAVEVGI